MTRRRRVAIVYQHFSHYREGILRELAQGNDIEYHFYADTAEFVNSGIPSADMTGLPFIRLKCRRIFGHVMWQSGLLRLAWTGKYDAVILLGDVHWPATWLALLLLRLRRRPAWLWTHGWAHPDHGWHRPVRLAFYRLAHGLLLYGYHAKQYAIGEGFESDRLQVIHNSLDLREIDKAQAELGNLSMEDASAQAVGDASKPNVICVTRLLPDRRVDMLIRALAECKRRGVTIRLILAGSGPLEDELALLARQLGVDLHREGAVYEERRLALLFRASRACVAPDQIGLMAVHSLAHGCPVITHDDWAHQGPEFEAVVPGVTGWLYKYGKQEELVHSILAAVNHGLPGTVSADYRSHVARLFSPTFQKRSIEWVIEGNPADDSFLA